MALRVAINGFGRIGRLVLRSALENASGKDVLADLEFVAINDLSAPDQAAHLLKYDSVHGKVPFDVGLEGDLLLAGNQRIRVLAEREPAKLPWGELGVDIVLECTGRFNSRAAAAAHLEAGAKRVLVSAPCDGADQTVVFGVNEQTITSEHLVVSNASCTTNCLAPVAHVLNEAFGLEAGFVTTVHAYTGDQNTVDSAHKDLRRARAAAVSMIPTSTGAARAVGKVLPALQGKLDGTAVRVPTANVSMVDLVMTAERDITVDAVNEALRRASESGPLKGVLAVNDEPLVSCDFNHNQASSVADLTQTQQVGSRMVRVLSWYDNEWGFSTRMLDTALVLGRTL